MSSRTAEVVLRGAVAEDAAALSELEEALFDTDAWSRATVLACLAAPGRDTLVVEVDARVVGYAVVGVAGEVADLERLAVAPEHRRCGLATALLRAAATRAAGDGAQRLLLEVSAANTAARALYAERGLQELDRRRRYYRDGSDAVVLVLPLVPCAQEADRD